MYKDVIIIIPGTQTLTINLQIRQAIMKYKSAEEFHNHLLEAIEKKRSYHLERFEEGKADEDKGAVDALAWAYTIIKLGKGNIEN